MSEDSAPSSQVAPRASGKRPAPKPSPMMAVYARNLEFYLFTKKIDAKSVPGVTSAVIYRIQNNKNSYIDPDVLWSLCSALSLTPDDLLLAKSEIIY